MPADTVEHMTVTTSRIAALLVIALAISAGCSDLTESTATLSAPPLAQDTPPTGADEPPPPLDLAIVATGAELYAEFCASCHGADLQGAENWRVPNTDGSYPPPPQDSSGHTWHHGDDLLVDLILDGSDFPQSRMPAFGDRLTEPDVLAVLEFFKSRWGPAERDLQWEVTLREGA